MAPAPLTWWRTFDGWQTTDGRWKIRGPIMGARLFWIYGPMPAHRGRFTPTGRYDDAASFPTARDAKRYVARLAARTR